VVDWSDIEPFVSHVPTARLQIPFRKLRADAPAKLAGSRGGASHTEGEEIIPSCRRRQGAEADVFEELDTEHQIGASYRARSDDGRPGCVSVMAPGRRVLTSSPAGPREPRLPHPAALPTGLRQNSSGAC